VFFEVVWKSLGKKRTVPVAPGAGAHLAANDSAVHVFGSVVQHSPESISLSGNADEFSETAWVFSGISEGVARADLEAKVRTWQGDTEWTILTTSLTGRISTKTPAIRDLAGTTPYLGEVLRFLMNAGAWPGNRTSIGLVALPHQLTDLRSLQRLGLTHVDEDGRWAFTSLGFYKVTLSKRLHSPRSAFEVSDRRPSALPHALATAHTTVRSYHTSNLNPMPP
jgi:hypothetical protein